MLCVNITDLGLNTSWTSYVMIKIAILNKELLIE